MAVLPTKNSTCVKSGVLHFKFRFFSYYFLFTFCLYWYKLNSINRRFIPAVPTLRWQAVASLLWPNKIVFPIYYHLVLIHTSSFYPNNQIILNILFLVEELKCNDGKLQLAFGYCLFGVEDLKIQKKWLCQKLQSCHLTWFPVLIVNSRASWSFAQ